MVSCTEVQFVNFHRAAAFRSHMKIVAKKNIRNHSSPFRQLAQRFRPYVTTFDVLHFIYLLYVTRSGMKTFAIKYEVISFICTALPIHSEKIFATTYEITQVHFIKLQYAATVA